MFVKDFRGSHPRFVYYLLKQLDLSMYNSGSVQPMLNRNYVAAVPLIVPEPIEQQAIAEVLRLLDDAVESSRRLQNAAANLAEALISIATHGAPIEPYTDAASVVMGAAFKGDGFSTPGIGRPLLRIRDLKTFSSQTWTTESRVDETEIQPGDIVVSMDAEFRATLWVGTPSMLNQRVCSFRPRDGVSRAFLLSALAPQLAFFENAKSGTTVIHLNKADIDRFTVPALTPEHHARLAHQTEPLLDLIVNSAAQSSGLIDLRDALLPELLSGRIRVPEAREAVESALA